MIDKNMLICDWSGRFIPMIYFQTVVSIDDADRGFTSENVGTPRLSIVSYTSNEMSTIKCSHSSICPFEKAQRGSLISTTDSSISNFVAQKHSLASPLQFHGAPSADTKRSICFALKSPISRQQIDICFKQAIYTRKKHAKETFFTGLGYGELRGCCSVLGRDSNVRKIKEILDVYKYFLD